MAKIEKIIEKMKNQPKGISFKEVKKVLEHLGYIEVRIRGSHHQFRNEQGLVTTVKKENPIDRAVIVDVLDRLGE
ncbi:MULTISPECIES: type II toxin-antitoxin system HicA family toxin [Cytobacillus]|uniref:Type II toxin-antitoxin system HicA family toxin n=1 Tax=Cytobacillus praedii TaxID=1742358 RepID=A0A4R1AV21_9BACI|nr:MULTISPECIES: type II toxin-antitoxin system HicA family toxin [Cytobacillus]TCJ01589.1 type II toxin-antitoxin system HicA family toxin [Cytobacillus praedii]USK56560.1 type II toxin-antitoxin system HicA family toxin [Cytobacillus solani]